MKTEEFNKLQAGIGEVERMLKALIESLKERFKELKNQGFRTLEVLSLESLTPRILEPFLKQHLNLFKQQIRRRIFFR